MARVPKKVSGSSSAGYSVQRAAEKAYKNPPKRKTSKKKATRKKPLK